MKFTLNHLNHNFIKIDEFKDFIYYKDKTFTCTKCNINIIVYMDEKVGDTIYYTWNKNPTIDDIPCSWFNSNHVRLTCEELLIKNIIE